MVRPPPWVGYAWAAPLSAVGLVVAALGRATGGGWRVVAGVVEGDGGLPGRLLPHLGVGVRPIAMTLGHVVIGVDRAALELTRPHERVHVHQAERWGALMPLAYLAASALAAARGRHPYHDNAFEQAAKAGESAGT
jgi:hypothetical protein